MGAGVHGVIIPDVRGKGLTPVVQRVAMGGVKKYLWCERGYSVPSNTLKAGVTIIGADMDGVPIWDLPLRGAVAFVFGGEQGLSNPTQ